MEVISTITYFLAYPHVRTDEKAFKYNKKTCCDDKNNSQCMPAYSVSFFTSRSSRISVLFMGEGGSCSFEKTVWIRTYHAKPVRELHLS